MTDNLLEWINNDLHLSRKVHIINEDFSNGYLFAEILYQYGVEKQLQLYEDSSTLAIKIRNLERLSLTLESTIAIQLTSPRIRSIMMEDYASIVALLEEIKDKLQLKKHRILKTRRLSPKTKDERKNARLYNTSTMKKVSDVNQSFEDFFIKDLHDRFQPKSLQFQKDIDMAIYLRRFQKVKWEFDQKNHAKCQNDKEIYHSNISANVEAGRQRHKELDEFRNNWNSGEHYKKWQASKLYLVEMEAKDLAMELTLAERKRLHEEMVYNKAKCDSMKGIQAFEKNMNRFGLHASSTNTQTLLKAVNLNETNALEHFKMLEERVAELDFRPSNNIQMMKELRERRRMQIADEKDRLMNRRKAMAEQSRSNTELNKAEGISVAASELLPSTPLQTKELMNAKNIDEPVVDVMERYFQEKRPQLESNYASLREIGQQRRDLANAEQRKKYTEREALMVVENTEICSMLVNYIIEIAMELQIHGPEAKQIIDLKEKLFVQTHDHQDDDNDKLSAECSFLLQTTVTEFLAHQGSWEVLFPTVLPIEAARVVNIIHTFLTAIRCEDVDLTGICSKVTADHRDKKSVSFSITGFFGDNDSFGDLIQIIALARGMSCISLDNIMEECILYSYDPTKHNDIESMNAREKILGAFGPKISSMRQKNSNVPLPNHLAIDIITAAIDLCHKGHANNMHGTKSNILNAVKGCILLNYPRTHQEYEVFEQHLQECIPDMLYNGFSMESPKSTALAAANGEEIKTRDNKIEKLSPKQSIFSAIIYIPSIDTEIPRPIHSSNGKGNNKVDYSDENLKGVDKFEQEQIVLRKNRENLVSSLKCKAHFLQIDSKRLEKFIVEENIQIALDLFAQTELARHTNHNSIVRQESLKKIPLSNAFAENDASLCLESTLIQSNPSIQEATDENELQSGDETNIFFYSLLCADNVFPEELMNKRQEFRSKLDSLTRCRWVMASNELEIDRDLLESTAKDFANIESILKQQLIHQFSLVHSILQESTEFIGELHVKIHSILNGNEEFYTILEQAMNTLKLNLSDQHRQRALTAVEVALGDIIDYRRRTANICLENEKIKSADKITEWIQSISEIVVDILTFIKSSIDERLKILYQKLYSKVPFLKDSNPREFSSDTFDRICVAIKSFKAYTPSHHAIVKLETIIGQLRLIYEEPSTTKASLMTALDADHPDAISEHNTTQILIHSLLQKVDVLCKYSSSLGDSLKTLNQSEFDDLEHRIVKFSKHKYKAISAAIDKLRTASTIYWESSDIHLQSASIAGYLRVAENNGQNLTSSQLENLIESFRNLNNDRTSSNTLGIGWCPAEQFSSIIMEIGSKHSFPSLWFTKEGLQAFISKNSVGNDIINWQLVIFTVIILQYTGLPSLGELDTWISKYLYPGHKTPKDTLYVSKEEYDRHKLWFEVGSTKFDTDRIKNLLWLLFSSTIDDDKTNFIPMILCWCIHPSSKAGIHPQLSSILLPYYSEGLYNACYILEKVLNQPPLVIREIISFVHPQDSILLQTNEQLNDLYLSKDGNSSTHKLMSLCTEIYQDTSSHFLVYDIFSSSSK